jgi:hypothetical protein
MKIMKANLNNMKTNLKVLLVLILLINFNQKSFSKDEKKDGIITLTVEPNDSLFVVNATVTDAATKAPLKGVEITFLIKRMYGDLKVGNATTDASGIVSASFSSKMPGSDTLGNINLNAKVEDNDVINDITVSKVIPSKVSFEAHTPVPPGMISATAPVWLKVTFWLIVGTVWGLFGYVTFLIYQISREKRKPQTAPSK